MKFLIVTYISGAIIAFVMSLGLTRRYGYRIVFATILVCVFMAVMSWLGICLMLDEYKDR